MAYLATRRTKEDDNDVFSSVDDNSSTSRSRQATEALERDFFLLRSAIGAEAVSTPQFVSEQETPKETLNVLLLHEMTRIRNVRRNSKHYQTIKIEFLTNNVVLRTKRSE